jgi:hypothetical protein
MRTFRARWDRFGLLQDTSVPREPIKRVGRASVDDFRALGAREMRTGIGGLYFLARIVLVVPVAIIFSIEWLVSLAVRGIAALVNRGA